MQFSWLGKISMKQGDKKRAKKMFQRVLRIVPDYLEASKALQKIM